MFKLKSERCIKTLLLSICLLFIFSCATGVKNKDKRKQIEASKNLGEAYLAEGDYSLALKEFLKVEAMGGDDPFLHNDFGLAYMGKGKIDLAITHFKKAIKLNPEYAPALNNLGTAYLAKKEWDKAIEWFEVVTNDILYATPHFPLSNMGYAYYHKGDYELSLKYYKEALDIEPKFVNALYGLGKTCKALGKLDEAVKAFEKAVALAPQLSNLLYETGLAYKENGDHQKAIELFKRVMISSPDSAFAELAEKEILRLGGTP